MTRFFSKQTRKLSLALPLAIVSVFSTAKPAQATLTSYIGAGGAGLVYSSVSNVTWTQDANLFKTMYEANNNLIDLIATVTPTYRDSCSGYCSLYTNWFLPKSTYTYSDDGSGLLTIDEDHFDVSEGTMTWWGGLAFTNYLNSITYGGSNKWRLSTTLLSHLFIEPAADSSELGQLFHSELGGTASNGIPNTTAFSNEQVLAYWLDGEESGGAWYFRTDIGRLSSVTKTNRFFAWAVSPGQIAAVPVPATIWLMSTGLLGLLSLKRRNHAA